MNTYITIPIIKEGQQAQKSEDATFVLRGKKLDSGDDWIPLVDLWGKQSSIYKILGGSFTCKKTNSFKNITVSFYVEESSCTKTNFDYFGAKESIQYVYNENNMQRAIKASGGKEG